MEVNIFQRLAEFYNESHSPEDGRFSEGPDGPGRVRDPGAEDLGEKGLVDDTKANESKLKRQRLTTEEKAEREKIKERIKAEREKAGEKPLSESSLTVYATKEIASKRGKTEEPKAEQSEPDKASMSEAVSKAKDALKPTPKAAKSAEPAKPATPAKTAKAVDPEKEAAIAKEMESVIAYEKSRGKEITEEKAREYAKRNISSRAWAEKKGIITPSGEEPKYKTATDKIGQTVYIDDKGKRFIKAVSGELVDDLRPPEVSGVGEGERVVRTAEGAARYGESVGQEIKAEPAPEPQKERGLLKRLFTKDTAYEQAQQDKRQEERAAKNARIAAEMKAERVVNDANEQAIRVGAKSLSDRYGISIAEATKLIKKDLAGQSIQRDIDKIADSRRPEPAKPKSRSTRSGAGSGAAAVIGYRKLKRDWKAAKKAGGEVKSAQRDKWGYSGETEIFQITTKEDSKEFGLPLGTIVELVWEEE